MQQENLDDHPAAGSALEKILAQALAQAKMDLSLTQHATIQAIFKTMESRDAYTAGHQKQVALIAGSIAEELGLSADDTQSIYLAGLVHDIGKIAIPSEILTKPSRLSHIEMQLVQQHAQIGYEILKDIPFPWPIAEMVHQHHERMDGSGYPQKLSGDQICVGARILAVADTIESMAFHRPYRVALGLKEAMDVVRACAGKQFDPSVAEATLRVMGELQTLDTLLERQF